MSTLFLVAGEGTDRGGCSNIDDDGFTHKLRLLKDRESGCIRLAAASQADSEEQDVTVWTAFSTTPPSPPRPTTNTSTVTNQINTPGWMYRSKSAVHVKNIRQFSFSSCFETNLWMDFELRFLQTSGWFSLSLSLSLAWGKEWLIPGNRCADVCKDCRV